MSTARRLALFALAAIVPAAIAAAPAAAAESEPAGGAARGEIAIATAGAVLRTVTLFVLGAGHRSGRVRLLGQAAAMSERGSGIPGWAALPAAISTVSLLVALFGMYWDISLHIDVGRDAGPLANPAHYFILAGLFGIFSAGFVAMVLPKGKPSTSAIQIGPDWYAPLGGVLVCACGAFSLMGFPLDDLWHRMFGQDVTLWGPTHLMLIGGAAMTLVGMSVLLVEGVRARVGSERRMEQLSWAYRARRVALTGGFLIGLSTFQAEFDFGVPQFQFVFQPLLIMLAASIALVATRVWLGRGSAIGAVAFFLAARGVLALLVGPVLGETTPHLPLYIVEALLVELVALLVPRTRPLAFGLWSGALIGTVGLAAEWGWSQLWMPIPWPSALLPEAALLGLTAALAGGVVGAWIGSRLAAESVPRTPLMRPAAVLGAAVIVALVGYGLMKPAQEGVTGTVTLSDVRGGPERAATLNLALDPPNAADDAKWLTATAWQGGGLVVDRLERTGNGRYRSTQPIPLHGNWKALIRLHSGRSLTAMPVYLPEDLAIPAREVQAPPRFERAFIADNEILQREQKGTTPWLGALGYSAVLGIALGLLSLLAWGLHRLASCAPPSAGSPPARQRRVGRRPVAAVP